MSSVVKLSRALFKGFTIPKSVLAKNSCPGERGQGWRFTLSKTAFNLSGYNKYGLYTDDILPDDNSIVKEALRRLPKDVLDARHFRIIRASHLELLKERLPEERWITYEEDLEYRYLQPYIREIEAERREIYEFGCVNYSEEDWPSEEVP